MSATFIKQLADLINDEVQKKVQEALSNYAESISKSYKIPLNLLLRDMPTNSDAAPIVDMCCLGVKKGGIRCKMQGKYEGYCRHHFMQKEKIKPIKISQSQELFHNHGIPPLHRDDCPACAQAGPSQPKRRPVIDYSATFM